MACLLAASYTASRAQIDGGTGGTAGGGESPKEKQQLRLQEFLKRTQFVLEIQGGPGFALYPNQVSTADPEVLFSEPARSSYAYGFYRVVAGAYFKKNLIEAFVENTRNIVSYGIIPEDPSVPVRYINSPATYHFVGLGYFRKIMLSNVSRFNVYPGIYFGVAIGSRFEGQPDTTFSNPQNTLNFTSKYSMVNRFVPCVSPGVKVELNMTHYLALTANAHIMVGVMPARQAEISYGNPGSPTIVNVQSSFVNFTLSMGLRFRMFWTGTVKKVQEIYPKPGKPAPKKS